MYSLDALSHNPEVKFCNWVISPAFGLFQPSKFGLHKTSSDHEERASPLATVEVECAAVTDGMLCALSISISPKKLNVEMKRRSSSLTAASLNAGRDIEW